MLLLESLRALHPRDRALGLPLCTEAARIVAEHGPAGAVRRRVGDDSAQFLETADAGVALAHHVEQGRVLARQTPVLRVSRAIRARRQLDRLLERHRRVVEAAGDDVDGAQVAPLFEHLAVHPLVGLAGRGDRLANVLDRDVVVAAVEVDLALLPEGADKVGIARRNAVIKRHRLREVALLRGEIAGRLGARTRPPPCGAQARLVEAGSAEQRVGTIERGARRIAVGNDKRFVGVVEQRFDGDIAVACRRRRSERDAPRRHGAMPLALVQLAIERADDAEHLDLQLGLVAKIGLDSRRAGVEQLARADLATRLVRRDPGVAGAKDGEQEVLHRGGAIGLVTRDLRLPRDAADADRQHHEGEPARRDRRAMAPKRSAGDVSPATVAGLHGLEQQMAFEIRGERLSGLVAPGRLLHQRLGDDGVEVAGKRAPQAARRARAPRGGVGADGGAARHADLGGDERRVERRRADRAGSGLEPIRALAGEQLEQDDAEREHVRGRAQQRARELLGRGGLRRQRARHAARRSDGVAERLLEQAGDAEVE